MRNSRCRFWVGLPALLAACSGGGTAGGDTAPPAVSGVAISTVTGGDADVEFALVDAAGRPQDVELEYSSDEGGSWRAATLAPGSVVRGLASSPSGVRHVLRWDSLADVGVRGTRTAKVRVRLHTGTAGVAPVVTTAVQNVAAAADRIEAWMIHYGALGPAEIALAKAYDLVVLYAWQPSVTRAVVAEIQAGVDPIDPTDDVIVLCHLDIAQDTRTIGKTDAELLADPRFVGDGTGPRVDPRGPHADGQPLVGLDPRGLPSVSGGYASFYLDDNTVDAFGVGDGLPDRSGESGACFVNAGDPRWYDVIRDMQVATDGIAGIREILSLDYGKGLGCDGLMLDNVDVCSPNVWTAPGSPDHATFEWTAGGVANFIARLKSDYPDRQVMQNRGVFFFDPRQPHYPLCTADSIDFLKFESYRLDADPTREFHPYYFADNKFNFAPRVQAEAFRSGSFQVLSLGYASGPGIDPLTLTGATTAGLDTLRTDVREAQEVVGFRHYLTNAAGDLLNDFVQRWGNYTDNAPPVWTSTYNANQVGWPTPPGAPAPRVGVQEALGIDRGLVLRWDVALDLNPVQYVCYYSDKEIRFDQQGPIPGTTTRVELIASVGAGYDEGSGPGVYPYEALIGGLAKNRQYWCCIRAVDAKGNEDANRVVLTARTTAGEVSITIDGRFQDWKNAPIVARDRRDGGATAGPDWREVRVTNDRDNLYVYFKVAAPFDLGTAGASPFTIHIDADGDPFTGYAFGRVGSEFTVNGDSLYSASASTPRASRIRSIAILPRTGITEGELAIPLADLSVGIGGLADEIRLLFVDEYSGDLAPDTGFVRYLLAR